MEDSSIKRTLVGKSKHTLKMPALDNKEPRYACVSSAYARYENLCVGCMNISCGLNLMACSVDL